MFLTKRLVIYVIVIFINSNSVGLTTELFLKFEWIQLNLYGEGVKHTDE